MSRTRTSIALVLACSVLLLILCLIIRPCAHATAAQSSSDELTQTTAPAGEPVIQQGLVTVDDALYYYHTDGTMFIDGYKELEQGETSAYYYFLRNGQAFTTGYKTVVLDGITHYFFFDSDGKAFTGGLKEISFGEESYLYFFGEDGKALTAQWLVLDGITYYFQTNGRAAQNGFFPIDGKWYYFDETYNVITDFWFCIEDAYYYADETGAFLSDTVAKGYRLDADGKAPTKNLILEYVEEHTDDSMTDQEKIDALYDWFWTNGMYYQSSYEHIQADWTWPDGWVDDFAVSMLDNWGGNCFRYAALFGMLVREATGLPVTVYHGTLPSGSPHGWTAIYQDGVWYAYDIQQDIQGLPKEDCYKVPYPGGVLHCNGIGVDLF